MAVLDFIFVCFIFPVNCLTQRCLPFESDKMYHFMMERFQGTTAGVQEQNLQWLQVCWLVLFVCIYYFTGQNGLLSMSLNDWLIGESLTSLEHASGYMRHNEAVYDSSSRSPTQEVTSDMKFTDTLGASSNFMSLKLHRNYYFCIGLEKDFEACKTVSYFPQFSYVCLGMTT